MRAGTLPRDPGTSRSGPHLPARMKDLPPRATVGVPNRVPLRPPVPPLPPRCWARGGPRVVKPVRGEMHRLGARRAPARRGPPAGRAGRSGCEPAIVLAVTAGPAVRHDRGDIPCRYKSGEWHSKGERLMKIDEEPPQARCSNRLRRGPASWPGWIAMVESGGIAPTCTQLAAGSHAPWDRAGLQRSWASGMRQCLSGDTDSPMTENRWRRLFPDLGPESSRLRHSASARGRASWDLARGRCGRAPGRSGAARARPGRSML